MSHVSGLGDDYGYPLPDSIPSETRCIIIYVPDQQEFIANLWGAITTLTDRFRYQNSDSPQAALVANEMLARVQAARLCFMADDCGGSIPSFQFNTVTGTLQIDIDGVWTDIPGTENLMYSGDFSDDPDSNNYNLQYSQGGTVNNIEIDASEQTVVYDTPDIDPTKDPTEQACAIATNLVEWWFDKYNDSIDAYEAAMDFVSALDSILVLFPPAYLIVDTVNDFISEINEFGAALARALDTVDLRQKWTEDLYCLIVNNSFVFDVNVWRDFEANHIIGEVPPIALFGISITDQAMVDQGIRQSYGTDGSCGGFVCDCIGLFYRGQKAQAYVNMVPFEHPTPPVANEVVFGRFDGIKLDDYWFQTTFVDTFDTGTDIMCLSGLGFGGLFTAEVNCIGFNVDIVTISGTVSLPHRLIVWIKSPLSDEWSIGYEADINSGLDQEIGGLGFNAEAVVVTLMARGFPPSEVCNDSTLPVVQLKVNYFRVRPAGTSESVQNIGLGERACW